ncbi:hypothetical protein PGN35_009375 [Nodosilinea sp. PGN35]|uniref:hypothetical protein n=1 Tax=Nodosilinea sp. PGN35 TaxID=3020489 RepID=UPI0023B33ECF|nr:hypothetical protein [Nodosilinea sp. TSF1-S3]MDF0368514.1 hypothetical protein [Nodosilinea sp. TSF1-S3]
MLGIRHATAHGVGGDRLLLIIRLMAIAITVLGVLLGLKVSQPGDCCCWPLTWSFAGLVVPLIDGLFWAKATRQGALACIGVGLLSRLLISTRSSADAMEGRVVTNLFKRAFYAITASAWVRTRSSKSLRP